MGRPAERKPVPHRLRPPRRQRGAVLILGLAILLVVTMLGISGQQTTVLQERLVGNMRQNNIALQAAEAALHVGLAYIEQSDVRGDHFLDGTQVIWQACSSAEAETDADSCTHIDEVLEDWQTSAVADITEGVDYGTLAGALGDSTNTAFPDVRTQPRVHIDVRKVLALDLADASKGVGTYFYTVTSVGFGGNDQGRAILQSTVAKHAY
ncbi:MAG: PilX N-terminal domain-containing pilus assembly protein [Thiohalocapsa sp.]